MDAVYRLDKSPASFNFLEFLTAAKTYGATHIVLDDTRGHTLKYKPQETLDRMATIVEPCCALAGLPFRYGEADTGMMDLGYHVSVPIKAYRDCGWIAKIKSVKPPGSARYTVTLRHYKRHAIRNSNVAAWRRFAYDIGAVVIEDWHDKPIDLHDRMALYAGAEMNYFSNGGPAALCIFSDYPYTLFMNKPYHFYLTNQGWRDGSQIPWANENQLTVWAEDTYENLTAMSDRHQAYACEAQR